MPKTYSPERIAQAREFMRREFGPDSESKNEDGTTMNEKQLNDCAIGWCEYADIMNSALSKK